LNSKYNLTCNFKKITEALGASGRVKLFCKYYREIKRLETTVYNQATSKLHQAEVYHVSSCVKSATDKRYAFDLTLENDKGDKITHTYQAASAEEYRMWFVALEGKDLAPVCVIYFSNYFLFSIHTNSFFSDHETKIKTKLLAWFNKEMRNLRNGIDSFLLLCEL
jgi:hypothetical protein